MTATLPLPLALPPKRERPGIPPDFVPSRDSLLWAAGRGYDRLDLDYENEQFVLYHLGHATKWKSWDLAWRSWIARSAHDKASALNVGRPSSGLVPSRPAQVDGRGFLRRDDVPEA